MVIWCNMSKLITTHLKKRWGLFDFQVKLWKNLPVKVQDWMLIPLKSRTGLRTAFVVALFTRLWRNENDMPHREQETCWNRQYILEEWWNWISGWVIFDLIFHDFINMCWHYFFCSWSVSSHFFEPLKHQASIYQFEWRTYLTTHLGWRNFKGDLLFFGVIVF